MPTPSLTPSKGRGNATSNNHKSRPRKVGAADASQIPVVDGSIDGALEKDSDASDGIRPAFLPASKTLPNHDEIAALAYCLSESRRQTGQQGDEMSDWLAAEQELLAARRR